MEGKPRIQVKGKNLSLKYKKLFQYITQDIFPEMKENADEGAHIYQESVIQEDYDLVLFVIKHLR